MDRTRRSPGLVGPLILISIGVILLLNNAGLLPWSIWLTLLQLWPVLLIVAGLDILIGRRSLAGSLLVAVLFLAILGGALWLATGPVGVSMAGVNAEKISQPLQGARRAQLEISHGITSLTLGSLQDSNSLVEGSVALDSGEHLTQNAQFDGDSIRYTLKTDGVQWAPFFGPRMNLGWKLSLNPDVPLGLQVNNAMGDVSGDLTRLNATDLSISAGMGGSVVTLPAHGRYQAKVSVGMGRVEVRIPEGLGARIHASSAIGSVSVSPAFSRQGDWYVSANYDNAENRVELEVSAAIGSVTVQ